MSVYAATAAAPPAEADWKLAPGLLEGAMELELTPEQCSLDYWIRSAPQGTWMGLVNHHSPDARVPPHMLESGPLRTAISDEFAFRALAEEMATRAISYLVTSAPDTATMEFYATQLIDEARHSLAFRTHLVELGVSEADLSATIQRIAGAKAAAVLDPLNEFSRGIMQDPANFIGGVVMLTILVEGVLAPAAELSERKWRLLDPAAASIERGANIDEIRHLTVGSAVVRRHLLQTPTDKPRVLDLIVRGRMLWRSLPVNDIIYEREALFQQGIQPYRDLLGSYELTPGRRLVDTTPEERLALANQWSIEMQDSRLRYMGLSEAIL